MNKFKKLLESKNIRFFDFIIGVSFFMLIILIIIVNIGVDKKNKERIDELQKTYSKLNQTVENLYSLMESKDMPTFTTEFKNINDNIVASKSGTSEELLQLNKNFLILGKELDTIFEKLDILRISFEEKKSNDEDKFENITNNIILLEERVTSKMESNELLFQELQKKNKIKQQAVQKPIEKEPDFVLILQGVMQTADGYFAYVSGQDKDKTSSVSVGSKINGWEVVEIESKSITIEKDGVSKIIKIDNSNSH